MSGIEIVHRDGTVVNHPTIWTDPEKVPVVFVVVKQGATALAHPDYVMELVDEVLSGDLSWRDAWDFLLVKTPELDYPTRCYVEKVDGDDGAWAEFRTGSRMGAIQHRVKI